MSKYMPDSLDLPAAQPDPIARPEELLGGFCKRQGHGNFTGKLCPKCCLHATDVALRDGPKCSDCGAKLSWIRSSQLEQLESQLAALKQERALDSERLDWLQSGDFEGVFGLLFCDLRESIDAARAVAEPAPVKEGE